MSEDLPEEDFNFDDLLADDDGIQPMDAETEEASVPFTLTPLTLTMTNEDEDGGANFTANVKTEAREGIDPILKPWMQYHHFTLVQSIEEVRQIVDAALAHGRCGLDLETQGLDNRIDYDDENKPHTRHKIVGFCISVKGHGYYLPIRHQFNESFDGPNPNLPVEQTEDEIRRLCLASQPVLTEEGRKADPYTSMSWAEPPRVIIYFWNAKFDQEFLFPITDIDFWHPESFEDGYLSAYVFYTDDLNLSLKNKALEQLSINGHPYEMIEINEIFRKGTKKSEVDFASLHPVLDPNVAKYGCSDAICTEILCEMGKVDWEFTGEDPKPNFKNVLAPTQTDKRFQATYKLEKKVVQAVRVMERSRTKIDKKGVKELLKEANKEREDIERTIVLIAEGKGFHNFNPGSPNQLSDFLFGPNGLNIEPKPEKNEKSQLYKTDASTLESFVDNDPDAPEILRWVVKFRQVDKVIGTYLTSLSNNTDENDRLRFNFRQTGAATGRFTAPKGPPDHGFAGVPIHGIPARVDPNRPAVANSLRRLFISEEGYTIIKIDYAGQELRVVTNISKEPLWEKEFLEGSGDLHTLTAQAFFGPHITKADKLERTAGKIANFSLIYGGGVKAIQRATKCNQHEAARKKKAFDVSVPIFAKWVQKQHAFVKKHLGVYTGFGRFIRIPEANTKVGDVAWGKVVQDEKSAKKIRAGCERKSTNYPIQGSGADILKISLVKLVKELHRKGWLRNGGDDSVRMLMTVHDEIVFEVRDDRVPEALPILIECMESPSTLANWKIPLIVEPLLGKSWNAKYDWVEIQQGKGELPDWLKPHFEAFEKKGPKPASEPAAALPPAPAEPKPETPRSSIAPQPRTGKPSQIVVFAVSKTLLTSHSVRLVAKAIAGAGPDDEVPDESIYKRLRLVDPEGNILLDPSADVWVNPEEFGWGLRECNLCLGVYDLVEE